MNVKPSQLPIYTKNGVTLAYNPPCARKFGSVKSSSEEKLNELSDIFFQNSRASQRQYLSSLSFKQSSQSFSSPHHHCCIKNVIHGPDRSCTSSQTPFDIHYHSSNRPQSSDYIRLSPTPNRGRISAIDRQGKRFRNQSESRSEPPSGLSSPRNSLPRCASRDIQFSLSSPKSGSSTPSRSRSSAAIDSGYTTRSPSSGVGSKSTTNISVVCDPRKRKQKIVDRPDDSQYSLAELQNNLKKGEIIEVSDTLTADKHPLTRVHGS